MKTNKIIFNIIIIVFVLISFNSCKKKDAQTEITDKVENLHGSYIQNYSYDFDISNFNYSTTYSDTSIVGTDTTIKTLYLTYNNYNTVRINDSTLSENVVAINNTTTSFIDHLCAECNLVINPFYVLQINIVNNIERTSFTDLEEITSDSIPQLETDIYNNKNAGTGSIDEDNNVEFTGSFFSQEEMEYIGTYSYDSLRIEGTFTGKIIVNFQFYFNNNLVGNDIIDAKDINNGIFTFSKVVYN